MRRIPISLVVVALLWSVPAAAQQMASGELGVPTVAPAAQPYPTAEVIPAGSAVDGVAGEQIPLAPQPEAMYQPGAAAAENIWGPQQPASPPVPAPGGGLYSVGPCDEVTGGGYYCPKNWYLDQRFRMMYHPSPRGTPVGQYGVKAPVQEPIGGTTVIWVEELLRDGGMTTKSPGFPPAGGYEVTLGHYLGRDADNRDHFLEFTYYGGNEWDATAALHKSQDFSVTKADGNILTSTLYYPNAEKLDEGVTAKFGNLLSPFNDDVTGFNRADDQQLRYESRFDNFELNRRITPRPRQDRLVLHKNGRWRREAQTGCFTSVLLGLRGMTLDEHCLFFSEGTTTFTDNPTAHTTGEYDVRTHNDLFGLQVGGDCIWRKGPAEAGMRTKAGVMMNFSDQFSTIVTTGAANDLLSDKVDLGEHPHARSRDVAGVAEFGFTAGYQLRRNVVVRAAYDLMCVSGLALAPEQFEFQAHAPARINNDGMLLMQSFSLGLELNW